jgi:hypothetical protein
MGARISMVAILVIGGMALVVALSVAVAIAPRNRPLVADVHAWPFDEHGHPVKRTELPRDDLA